MQQLIEHEFIRLFLEDASIHAIFKMGVDLSIVLLLLFEPKFSSSSFFKIPNLVVVDNKFNGGHVIQSHDWANALGLLFLKIVISSRNLSLESFSCEICW